MVASIGTARIPVISNANQRAAATPLPTWAHPDVKYWWDEYQMIRHTSEGERAVKDHAQLYLPRLEGMEGDEYEAYLDRATFYNFTGRTVSALAGTILRREPMIEGISPRLKPRMTKISKDNKSFIVFFSLVAEEVIRMGRYAVLIDLPEIETTDPRPYLSGYTAENIVDWEEGEIEGRTTLTRVVLREVKLVTITRKDGSSTREWRPQYRQLRLTSTGSDREYVQEIYANNDREPLLEDKDLVARIFPRFRGNALKFLPIQIFGPHMSSLDVEKAPMQDIARLNISHYRSYANLEHGRLFCGFPIYYVEAPQGGGEDESEFKLGASRVWITPPGAKPGLLELNGQGLKFLVDGMDQKEAQAAALGGRMMGVRTTSTAESDNSLKLSERNEQAVLLKITRALDEGTTQLMVWWCQFQGETDTDKVLIYFNKDFLFDMAGAREFRAIHAMYKDGILPIEVLHDYFRKAAVIPDWMDLEEFRANLEKLGSFPNNADVAAKKEGYPDAQAKQMEYEKELDRETEIEVAKIEADASLSVVDKQTKTQTLIAEKNAKIAASKPKPVPGKPAAKPAPKA